MNGRTALASRTHRVQRTLDSLLDRPWFTGAALTLPIVWMLATGVAGVGRDRSGPGLFHGNVDFEYLFQAGRVWVSGQSPYILANYREAWAAPEPFAYFPTIAPLCAVFGVLPRYAAELSMLLLNLASLAVIILGSIALVFGRVPLRVFTITASLACLLPFVSHVLWMGQTSLLAAGLVIGALWAFEKYPVLAGFLAAAATIKPQISALIVLWLLFRLEPRFCISFAVALVLLVLGPIVVSGPVGLGKEWLNSVSQYQRGRVQYAGFQHVFGLRSLFYSAGIQLPTLAPIALMTLLIARRLQSSDIAAVLLAASMLLIYAHDYDLVCLIPMIPAFLRILPRWDWRAGLSLAAYCALMLPQRVLRGFDLPLLLRYRELVVLALLVALVTVSFRGRNSHSAVAAAGPSL